VAAALRAGVPQVLLPLMFDQFFWAEQLVWRGLSPDMHGTTLRSLLQAPSAAAAAGREQRALAEPAPAPLAMASPSAGGAELEFTALEEALCTVTAPAWAPGFDGTGASASHAAAAAAMRAACTEFAQQLAEEEAESPSAAGGSGRGGGGVAVAVGVMARTLLHHQSQPPPPPPPPPGGLRGGPMDIESGGGGGGGSPAGGAAGDLQERPGHDDSALHELHELRLPNGTVVLTPSPSESTFIYGELFEEFCYFQHSVRAAAGGTVVDVGANVGLFLLQLEWLFAGARSRRACAYACHSRTDALMH
jgi:hypothetical protein